MIVVGAGHAGLMAGCLIPGSEVFEASAELNHHRAVLRFRSPDVGNALGIPFQEVTVRKGIFYDGDMVFPDIALANLYSQKVTGGLLRDRSIWKIESDRRWIAPEDFTERMAKILGSRLMLSNMADFSQAGGPNRVPHISTIPMPVLDAIINSTAVRLEFKSRSIYARRWRLPDSKVHQTIYYPDPDLCVYRASITGDLLSAEYTEKNDTHDLDTILESFAFHGTPSFVDDGFQKFGKIIEINENWRRSFIINMTRSMNIYSLGRFATWRNILLDDVLKDISVIKKLVSTDDYGRSLT